MIQSKIHQNIIIGGGPAGLTAAIYLGRDEKSPIVLVGPERGGQLATMAGIANYPGFPTEITGPELAKSLLAQAENCGAELVYQSATAVDLSQRPFKIWTNTPDQDSRYAHLSPSEIMALSPDIYREVALAIKKEEPQYLAQTIIVATGTRRLLLGLPHEKELIGRGISFCATCDGPFFKNKIVSTVGGGNVALEEALALSKFADQVHFIHLESDFSRSDRHLQDEVRSNPKIKLHFLSQIKEIRGEKKIQSLLIEDIDGLQQEIDVDGLFIAIGSRPNTIIFNEYLEFGTDRGIKISFLENSDLVTAQTLGSKDERKTSDIKEETKHFNSDLSGILIATNIEGVYAAGDVSTNSFKQIVWACAGGAAAARTVTDFLNQ